MNKSSQDWTTVALEPSYRDFFVGDNKEPASQGSIPLLLQYWRIFLRWKYLIAGIVAGALIVGLIVTLLMQPLYTATATIEIARQNENIVNIEGVQPETAAVDMEFYQTQYSLLKARSLANTVATDLRLTRNDEFFDAFGIDASRDGLFSRDSGGRLTAAEQAARQKLAVDTLIEHISISPIRGSSLVDVSFTSPDPALSKRIVDAWTTHFIETNLQRRFEATSYARKFLEERLEQLRQRLEESERQLVAYASNQKIINIISSEGGNEGAPRQERPILVDDLQALNLALAEATADRIRAESRLRGSSDGSSKEALGNAAITALREKRAEVAAEHAKLMVQFEPEYPQAKALASQLAALDRSIAREEARVQSNLNSGYGQERERENALRRRVDELKSNLLDLRRRSIQYNIYQRDVDTNRQLYDGLLQRYKEIGIAGGVGTNNIAIVDAANLPERPSSPRISVNLMLALLLGIALAAAAVFALEQIDEAIKDPSDLGKATDLPLLGAIPLAVNDDILELLNDRKSPQTEAYLSVQTSLQFATDHGFPRSVAVTSTRPSEGKSSSAYAIAQSLARTKRRVVLVDGDMRSPSVHALVGIPNEQGTSNFLAGDDSLTEMISSVDPLGIKVISAGPTPPNAAELLTGPRLKLLVDRLLEDFDHVVIDSPPVLGLADAPLLGSRVEGVIYVIETRGARSSMIRTAIARLASANINLLGVVLTKYDAKRAHYGYGYDYGYGYGQSQSPNTAPA